MNEFLPLHRRSPSTSCVGKYLFLNVTLVAVGTHLKSVLSLSCMELFEAVRRVRSDDSFIPEDGYLVHGFFDETWHVGFYNASDDRITTYVVGDKVSRSQPEDVFKDGKSVPELDLSSVEVVREKAERIARAQLSQKHPNHPVTKQILLVQSIGSHACYNITLVTSTLHMYNIKIRAQTGEVVSDVFDSILSLKAE